MFAGKLSKNLPVKNFSNPVKASKFHLNISKNLLEITVIKNLKHSRAPH
jgi:hypothetical protein